MAPDLLAAIENGELTQEQLRELISYEAGLMGLDYATAVTLARHRRLPKTALGMDVELLIEMLDGEDA